MIIAVDFDGTIVEHRYPEIGRERPFAVATLRQMQADDPDLRLILWTVREGKLLEEAVEWCRARGLEFFAVNANYPGELPGPDGLGCRKVSADLYIDDRNYGRLPDWPTLYRRLKGESAAPRHEAPEPRRGFLGRLFGRKDSR